MCSGTGAVRLLQRFNMTTFVFFAAVFSSRNAVLIQGFVAYADVNAYPSLARVVDFDYEEMSDGDEVSVGAIVRFVIHSRRQRARCFRLDTPMGRNQSSMKQSTRFI